jgi:hypothetical protein
MQPEEVEPAANEKAQRAKREMKNMPPEVLKKLGFESAEQLEGATLGSPHKVYIVNLNDVKAFKSGDDPKKIIGKTKEILYPILENGNVTSAIGFRKEKGDWIPTTLGASSEVKVAEPVRDKHGKSKGKGHSSYFVARVPAMYLSFLGYWDKNDIFFIPIATNPDFPELDPGREIPAAEAFLALQAKTEKYEGLLKDRPEETR